MRKIVNGWGRFATLLCTAVLVAACGGGGGGGEVGSQSVKYTGNLSQAELTDSSVETVALEAYAGGEAGGGVTELLEIGPMGGGGASFAASALPATVGKAVGGVPRYTASGSMPGNCGGSVGYSVNFNETTGDFSYNFHFKSYCEPDGQAQTVINGSIGFSGKVDPATGEADHLTATFGFFTSSRSDGSESITMSGTVGMAVTGLNSGTMTMSFVTKDNITGKTYWVDNYLADMTDYGTYEEITISGRFYHHDHGYVDVSTVSPLQIYPLDEHPAAGMLELDGAGGNSARIAFLSPLTYQVIADLNGDGLFDDFDSGEKPWQ